MSGFRKIQSKDFLKLGRAEMMMFPKKYSCLKIFMNYDGQVKTSWSALFLKEIPDGPNDINFKTFFKVSDDNRIL